MALPNTLTNGTIADAAKVQENFNYVNKAFKDQGIYDADAEYDKDDVVNDGAGTPTLWYSLQDGNSGHALAAGTWWSRFGAGEANTASNVGAGTGTLFKVKSGVELQFKTLKPGSTKLGITNNTDDVTLNVVESALTLGNMGGTVDATRIADGAATDNKIGNRTVNDALATPASSGTLTQLLSWIAGRLMAITGKTSWLTAPALTLEALSAHKSRHATGGADALSAADIGAAAASHNHAGADINSGTVAAARLGTMSGASSVASGASGAVPQPVAGDDVKVLYGDGSWQTPPGASGGEANTASNVGTSGVGIFKVKSGIDLQFKKIKAGANVTVTDTGSEVQIDASGGGGTADNRAVWLFG